MKIAISNDHFLKHISVGGICNLCDDLCHASSVLAMKIDLSDLMGRMQLCEVPLRTQNRRRIR